jgi:hypothetical protein
MNSIFFFLKRQFVGRDQQASYAGHREWMNCSFSDPVNVQVLRMTGSAAGLEQKLSQPGQKHVLS